MKFREAKDNDGCIEYTYNEDLKVLSPIAAYRAMIEFLEELHDKNPDEEFGQVISQILFNGCNDTDHSRSWDSWERIVTEEIKRRGSRNRVQNKTD